MESPAIGTENGINKPGGSVLLDVAPTTAFIQATPIHSLAASRGMRFVFMGGDDGFVRKYDFEASLNGQSLLSSAQRHMLPDSVTKSGVLSAVWENEQLKFQSDYQVLSDGSYHPHLSSVYSLACQSEALWVASGLENGDISIQSATYGELGQPIAYLRGHTKAVSDLKLSSTESQMISGSWDRSVVCWDLDAGIARNKYSNLSAQVSSVDWQTVGANAVQQISDDDVLQKEKASAKNDNKGDDDEDDDKSLFGSDDSSNEAKEDSEEKGTGEVKEPGQKSSINTEENGIEPENESRNQSASSPSNPSSIESNVFLSSLVNGRIDIWDTRQAERASTLLGSNSPPWCMSASFSKDGNLVFAARRNSCVEVYDIRSVSNPLRTLKFPAISGAVTCVTPMPDNHRVLCACYDNIRLYDLQSTRKTPFTIVPGHHGTNISRMIVSEDGKYIVSATGGRGWIETTNESALAYETDYE